MKLFSNIRGDLLGGLASSVVTVPPALGFGVLIFSQIGNQFSTLGAFAGICGAIFSVIVSAIFGGTPTQITAPAAPSTAILMSFTASLIGFGLMPEINDANLTIILGWIFLTVMLAGVFQFLFGILRFGQLTKYLPYAVLVGFLNGIGLILIIKQIQSFLGFKTTDSFIYIFNHISNIQSLTVTTGVLTLIILFNSGRLTKKIPGPLISVILGSLFFYLFHFIFPQKPIGAVIGDIGYSIPQLKGLLSVLSLGSAINSPIFFKILFLSSITALTLALMGSLQSLLTSLVADIATGTRHDSNRELIGQGLGNFTSGLFGGLHCASLPTLTMVNINSGAKTRLSGIICGLLMLLYLLIGWSIIAKIPHVVIAAVIMYLGYIIIDKQSWVELFNRKGLKLHKDFYLGLGITTVVTIATLALNIIIAIGLGIIIAIFIYLQQTSQSVIRSHYTINQIHSRVRRSPFQQDKILDEGREGKIFQLQGSLFFASAANLSDEVEASLKSANYIILDMKHIVYCDITALKVLQRLFIVTKKRQKHLLFSNLVHHQSILHLMETIGMLKVIDKQYIFDTTDLAIEWVENQILSTHEDISKNHQILLEESGLFDSLSIEEKTYLETNLTQKRFTAGSVIFEKEEERKDLYILLEGKISIYSKQPHSTSKGKLRLIGLSPRSIFGEIAFLTDSERTTDAIAVTDCFIAALSQEKFDFIKSEQPQLAIKIFKNLFTNMVYYMRHMLREFVILENL